MLQIIKEGPLKATLDQEPSVPMLLELESMLQMDKELASVYVSFIPCSFVQILVCVQTPFFSCNIGSS